MVALLRTRGQSKELRSLADRIRISQTDEIKYMKQWLEERGQSTEMDMGDMSSMSSEDMKHMSMPLMPGMLTPQQMDALAKASGRHFDHLFLTGMMLLAMNDRSFVVTTAYLKTEAIQTAIFGFIFLGDHLTALKVVAILIATAGVIIAALRPGAAKGFADLKPTLLGLGAAATFALSAVGFRGAVIAVPGVSFVTAASCTLVLGLFVQTLVLTIYLLARAPDVLKAILGLWRPSLLAGFMGAFASQFWFLALALTVAANVRTLALVEVLFAQAVAYYSFKQPLSGRELGGIALIVIGVALLVAV